MFIEPESAQSYLSSGGAKYALVVTKYFNHFSSDPRRVRVNPRPMLFVPCFRAAQQDRHSLAHRQRGMRQDRSRNRLQEPRHRRERIVLGIAIDV